MLSKNIVYLRKQKQMTQETLAEKLNVSRQAVSKWESGLTEPDIQTLIQLSEIFEVSLDELIKGEHQEDNVVEKQNETKKSTISMKKYIMMLIIIVIGISLLGLIGTNNDKNNNSNVNSEVNSWEINQQLKKYDFIHYAYFDIDVISYNKQKLLFNGHVSAWDFLEKGHLTIRFKDGSEEVIELIKKELNTFEFEKEIPAKNINYIVIVLDKKEAIIKPIMFRIIDYMYGSTLDLHIDENNDSFELDGNFGWIRERGTQEYFDPCMNVKNKSEDSLIDIFPIHLKVVKNDKLLKEIEVNNYEELSNNIVIDEPYNSLADYGVHVEYKTPLGDDISYIAGVWK